MLSVLHRSDWEGHLLNDLSCLETQVSLRCRAQSGCVVQSVQCHTVAPVRYSLSEVLLVSLSLLSCLGVFIVSYLHVVHNVQCVS